MGETIRVLLADHNPSLRAGLRAVVEQTADIALVAETESAEEMVKQLNEVRPDVLVLDSELPGLSLPEVAKAIHKLEPPARVLVLGLSAEGHAVLAMLQAGALGYLLRIETPETIVMAVRAVAQGAGFFGPAVATQMTSWMKGARPRVAGLTRKDAEVLRLLAQGKGNKEIASALGMRERTVEYHVSRILSKLQLDSRTQAAMWARERGLDKE